MTEGLIYLAAPYSHKDRSVMVERFLRINKVAAKLMERKAFVFSPISHTHPIADAGTLPRGWEFWEEYDTIMISRCTGMFVLTIDGWQESKGVTAEIKIAQKLGLPIDYINEDLV